jgi:malonyl-CoA O-methyltransferase
MPAEPERLTLPTREGYDLWAEIYDDEANPLVLLEEPLVERLLGEVRGLAVLDVGCGTGRHAVRLAQAGAHVTGLDFSRGMLAKARAKAGAEKVDFREHDLGAPLPFEDASFDRVLACLVLDHVFELAAFFSELRRVCRPDGCVVASVLHPAMLLRGVQARFHEPDTGRVIQPRSAPNRISDYVMGALAGGLRLLEISEHDVDERLVGLTGRAERYLGWPLLLLLKLSP